MQYSLRACLIALVGLVAFSLPSSSETAAPKSEVPQKRVYSENFDGADRSLMLGGQLDFTNAKSKWLLTVSDGKMVLENRFNPMSLQYQDIKWVRYEGEGTVSTTEDARISVTVEAANQGRGGAGVLVGSGKLGNYLVFAVGKEGHFHVLQKERGKARFVYSGQSELVNVQGANRVTFAHRDGKVAFFANGKELIAMPYKPRTPLGVGLAAFGIGSFTFDDVEISK